MLYTKLRVSASIGIEIDSSTHQYGGKTAWTGHKTGSGECEYQ